MFYGRTTNNTNTVNVNTKLFTSYSDACMISLGAWNQQLSLKFHPSKGLNADGIRQYAQDNTEIINTSITVPNASALLEGIKDKLEKAISEKGKESISIPISTGENRKMLTLAVDGEVITLSIALKVNEQGVADPNSVMTHEFPRRNYITGYDCTTGTGTVTTVQSDYIDFKKKLESIYSLAPVIPHAINYNNAVRSNRSTPNNGGMNNQQTQNSGYQAPTSNFSGGDMSDFLPYN